MRRVSTADGRIVLAVLFSLLIVPVASGGPAVVDLVLGKPPASFARLGEGVAVVFSPDLSVPGNRAFYESLGFRFFDDADWRKVIRGITEARDVRVVIIESHGTNGHGLKLQRGKKATDERSYIAVGALQEALEKSSVRAVFLSACNSGRLLRPSIYNRLNPAPGDPLFLPATLGIVDASETFDPAGSEVRLFRRKQSNLETLLVGNLDELPSLVRGNVELVLARKRTKNREFVISTMLMQMLMRDPRLELVAGGFVERHSRADLPKQESERIFQRFLDYLTDVSTRELTAADDRRASAKRPSLQ